MNKFLSIKDAAKYLGVSPQTLRRWERKLKIVPSYRTIGGQRRYLAADLQPSSIYDKTMDRPTVAYARVSSHDQKEDLERQKQALAVFCTSSRWTYEIISDLGSGMNYKKRG